jgi:hypothetical protein
MFDVDELVALFCVALAILVVVMVNQGLIY